MSRLFGVVAIVVGAGIIVVSPDSWSGVFLNLPSDRAIHTYDLIGGTVIVCGILLLWR